MVSTWFLFTFIVRCSFNYRTSKTTVGWLDGWFFWISSALHRCVYEERARVRSRVCVLKASFYDYSSPFIQHIRATFFSLFVSLSIHAHLNKIVNTIILIFVSIYLSIIRIVYRIVSSIVLGTLILSHVVVNKTGCTQSQSFARSHLLQHTLLLILTILRLPSYLALSILMCVLCAQATWGEQLKLIRQLKRFYILTTVQNDEPRPRKTAADSNQCRYKCKSVWNIEMNIHQTV